MTTADVTRVADEAVLRLLAEGNAVCQRTRRPDLSHVLEVAAARLRRPATVLCVVGEYKQGKSHVINALVGRNICKVDDDLATAAITVVGHGEEPIAYVRRTQNGEQTTEEIPLEDVPRFTVEDEQGESFGSVDLVEVAIPSPVLERGIAIVDTPGVNAFKPGHDKAILDFLTYADGLILVTDASAELSPSELRFLAAAYRVCPSVLVALSKVDLYPEWRRIAELDEAHLAGLELTDSLVPISSTLRGAAIDEEDDELDVESGFPGLLGVIDERVLDTARLRSRKRALTDLDWVVSELRSVDQAQLQALEDPDEAKKRLGELRKAQEGVGRLRQASAKWGVALNDGIGDLRNEVDYRLRSAMRQHLQESDRMLADSGPKAGWEEMTDHLKSALADLAEEIFESIRQGTEGVARRIAELIAEEVPDRPLGGDAAFDVDALWATDERVLTADGAGVVATGLGVLRGGYSGMLMLSMLAQVAGIAILGPLTLGVGALFGAKQFKDERKRQLERQRQEARTVVRQFLDHVQHELGTRIQRAVQDAHRALRDHFDERIRHLSATYSNATRVLQESLAADAEQRAELTTAVRQRITALDNLASAASAATGDGP